MPTNPVRTSIADGVPRLPGTAPADQIQLRVSECVSQVPAFLLERERGRLWTDSQLHGLEMRVFYAVWAGWAPANGPRNNLLACDVWELWRARGKPGQRRKQLLLVAPLAFLAKWLQKSGPTHTQMTIEPPMCHGQPGKNALRNAVPGETTSISGHQFLCSGSEIFGYAWSAIVSSSASLVEFRSARSSFNTK